jgi:hypothetical protein
MGVSVVVAHEQHHPDTEGSIQRVRHGFHQQFDTHSRFYALHELYRVILTAMVSSGDVLFCDGLQAATYCTVGRCNKRGNLALKSKSVRGLPTRSEDPESAQRCSMDNWLYYHQGTLVL